MDKMDPKDAALALANARSAAISAYAAALHSKDSTLVAFALSQLNELGYAEFAEEKAAEDTATFGKAFSPGE